MKFVWKIVLSRMKRQKTRLLFVLLAIAASSCLIVWTVGGFQAIFIDSATQDLDYLGQYDLRIAADAAGGLGGGGGFGGPFASREKSPHGESGAKDAEKRGGEKPDGKSDAQTAASGAERGGANPGARGGRAGRGGPGGRGEPQIEFSEKLVSDLRADEDVEICDETAPLRMFVYSPGMERFILQDADPEDEGVKPTLKRLLDLSDGQLAEVGDAPEGIDPELHRKAFGAYRATMGTPMGMGGPFQATTASEAPYELKEGRWFQAASNGEPAPREAVMTTRGNMLYKAKVGDSILLIDRPSLIGTTTEYQLKVVGVVDDPESDGFYISRSLANEISTHAAVKTGAVYLKLRGDPASFRERWNARLAKEVPNAKSETEKEIADRKTAALRDNETFKYQAASGALLAALAALLIVFTALNMSVDEEKRLIAFYRISGLTRLQVGLSVLFEAVVLAAPGWILGMGIGWLLVLWSSGKATGLNPKTVNFSFWCTFIGTVLAALYPMFRSARVKPLDAMGTPERRFLTGKRRRRQTARFVVAALAGLAAIGADLYIIYNLPGDSARRAAMHSGVGVMLLAAGVVCILPLAIRIAEFVLLPVLAFLFRFDYRMLRHEFSGNAGRVAAVAVALSVGGGLYVTMQIWGYSMLDPFLPGRRAPDAFVAFLPNGLRPELVDELKRASFVDPERFVPIAIEQAAFAEGTVPDDPFKRQFANVVFFGVDVEKAFEGKTPLVGFRFRQGNPKEAFRAMKSGRGVIVTDSLSVDYALNVGDTLKTVHPRDEKRVLEYPIVGVVSFPGWQWLSKTGGVRRNFGRSGGIVFAREDVVADDYQIERRSYFWFDAKNGESVDYGSAEYACDYLARKNLLLDCQEGTGTVLPGALTAYAKLSTRESLTESITRRADSVIWGLSKTPLITLMIAAIAVIGAIANSIRARRWQYGVMRAVGTTRGTIIRAVLAEAVLIGTVAAFASFIFGFLAAQGALKLGQSMFGSLDPPLILPFKRLAFGLGLTVALCLVAALGPAIKIGRAETLKLLQSGRAPE